MLTIKNTDYVFLCSQIRARETMLLSRENMLKMAEASDYGEAVRWLEGCGYPDLTGLDEVRLEDVFAEHRRQILAEVAEYCPEPQLLESFRLRYDFHNVKVLVKAAGAGVDGSHLLSACGNIDPALLAEAMQKDDIHSLPPHLGEAFREAAAVMARTGNPQLVDIGLDKAYYAAHLAMDRQLSDDFLMGYTRLRIDSANLRSIIRCMRNGVDENILKEALIPGGLVDTPFILASLHGGLDLAKVFAAGDLEEAAVIGLECLDGGRIAPFELACDNCLTRYLDKAKLVSFGTAPVVAFLDSLESEIIAVRVILRGKLGGIRPEILKERLCEAYV